MAKYFDFLSYIILVALLPKISQCAKIKKYGKITFRNNPKRNEW